MGQGGTKQVGGTVSSPEHTPKPVLTGLMVPVSRRRWGENLLEVSSPGGDIV